MKYAKARYEIECTYRTYVTDSLKASTENMADAFGGNIMTLRWAEIYAPDETREADDIINGIRNKIEGEDESI